MLERPKDVPEAPGSYQFKDRDGRVIYVGKARSLRSRLATYFGDPAGLPLRTQQMLERAASVEWIQVRSDVEAIMLEYNLIKEHRPRFNIRLVDDKSYPYLAITMDEEWPRAMVVRGAKRKGSRYFGPYAHAYALARDPRFSAALIPDPQLLEREVRPSRPPRPPVPLVPHRTVLRTLCRRRRSGDVRRVPRRLDALPRRRHEGRPLRLESEMQTAAGREEFELSGTPAATSSESARLASERQDVVAASGDNLDVFGVADAELESAVQVLHVRHGLLVGRNGFIVEKVEPLSESDLLQRVLEQHYAETPLGVAREILVPTLPTDAETYTAWLSQRRDGPVAIRVPQRGRKRALVRVAENNAREQLARHRTRRATDLSSRARALEQLREYLGLRESPLRIECYDMSHLQGSDYVGSMVVMEDGLMKRSDYRRFKVRAVAGNDDYAAMAEVLERRLRRLSDPQPRPSNGAGARRPRRFAIRRSYCCSTVGRDS